MFALWNQMTGELRIRSAPNAHGPVVGHLTTRLETPTIGDFQANGNYNWLPIQYKGKPAYVAYQRLPQGRPFLKIEKLGMVAIPEPVLWVHRDGVFPLATRDARVIEALKGMQGKALPWDDTKGFGVATKPVRLRWYTLITTNKCYYYLIQKEPKGRYLAFVTDDMRFTVNGDPHITLGGFEIEEQAYLGIEQQFNTVQKGGR